MTITADYISADEEHALLFELEAELAERMRLHRVRAPQDSRTSIMRWGAPIYPAFNVHPDLPPWSRWLADQLPMTRPPESMTLNVWEPGDRLDPHVDRGGDVVCVLNLLAGSTLAFSRGHVELYEIPRRGLLRIEGEARWQWEHGVFPANERRISLVFRNTKSP